MILYRWGSHPPQESPAPPRATTVALVVGDPDSEVLYLRTPPKGEAPRASSDGRSNCAGYGPRVRQLLWSGDVTPEIRAWARWCALQVADLWDCPDVVRRYLETGDDGGGDLAAAWSEVWRNPAPKDYAGDSARGAAWSASNADWELAQDAAWDSARAAWWAAPGPPGPWPANNLGATEVDGIHSAHLRTLLLRRALTDVGRPGLTPLAEDPACEPVVCDALLMGRN